MKLLYTCENKVSSYINALEGEYTAEEVKKGLLELHEMQNSERENWNSTVGRLGALEALFRREKKEEKT